MFVCEILRVLLTSASSRWHCPQSLGTLIVATADFILDGGRMSCVPWQSLHPGANVSFAAAFRPWMLAPYCFCSSPWHDPQSTFASLSACGTSFPSVWPETQSGPPCGEAFNAAAPYAG